MMKKVLQQQKKAAMAEPADSYQDCCQNIKNKGFTPQSTIDIIKAAKQIAL